MPSQAPPETVEWLKTARYCDKCWPLADAIKFYSEAKSYDRGQVDFAARSVPEYPRTAAQIAAQLPPAEPEPEKVAEIVEFLGPAAEYPLDTIIKRTKAGKINTQSTVGKVVSLATEKGCELKVGGIWSAKGNEPYERNLWLHGAHHGLRFSVTGATVILNGRIVPKEDLFIALELLKEE